ncbi:unnamed protein product [Bemisia tabaci]|uniref:G2/M phase-specific E3 ubiquitin-protein ligase n=2 Tax=Bemisia tabaci TaxID=7038 RepID=A0A9P0AFH0_BEMTA|nr:unnamed protein product [Bemisia tabaci]
MVQNGQDEEGILGFLVPDILEEKKRAQKTFCDFCQLPGATVYCASRRCKLKFHVPCGVRNDCLNQFFGAFRSYCVKHRPEQKIPPHIIQEAKKSKPTCTICFEDVVAKACPNTLWAPCCSKNAWFHRTCIQSLAISAGYFFKCPLCNDKEKFQKAMFNFGIYVPQQDASWETAPNAFHELLERHSTCDIPACKCPKNRRFNAPGTIWELILCSICASQGIHIGCGLKFTTTDWECPECCKTIKKAKTSKQISASDSDDSSSDESNSVSKKSRSRIKNKKIRRKKHKKVSNPSIAVGDSSRPLSNSSSNSNTNVPDENADIIIISSDDDLIEIMDSPEPNSSFIPKGDADEDSSSDIDVISTVVTASSASKHFEAKQPSEGPTAFIRIHNPSGGVTTVPAASFKNSVVEMSSTQSLSSSESRSDGIFILDGSSDANQNHLKMQNSNRQSDRIFSSSERNLNAHGSASNGNNQNQVTGSHNYELSSDVSCSTTASRHFNSATIESTCELRRPPDSLTDLPSTSDEIFLRRYSHLGLKSAHVVIRPLKFRQIGKNRFLTIIPSQSKKRGRKRTKLQLQIHDNQIVAKNYASLSNDSKRRLRKCRQPLKELLQDLCNVQTDHHISSRRRSSNQASTQNNIGRSSSAVKTKPQNNTVSTESMSSSQKTKISASNSTPRTKDKTVKSNVTSIKTDAKKFKETSSDLSQRSTPKLEISKASEEPCKISGIERYFKRSQAGPSNDKKLAPIMNDDQLNRTDNDKESLKSFNFPQECKSNSTDVPKPRSTQTPNEKQQIPSCESLNVCQTDRNSKSHKKSNGTVKKTAEIRFAEDSSTSCESWLGSALADLNPLTTPKKFELKRSNNAKSDTTVIGQYFSASESKPDEKSSFKTLVSENKANDTNPPKIRTVDCNKSSNSSSDQKKTSLQTMVKMIDTKPGTTSEPRSRGRLVPISLFDPPEVLESKRAERILKLSLASTSGSDIGETSSAQLTDIKQEPGKPAMSHPPKKSRVSSKNSKSSTSLSQKSQDSDSSDTVFKGKRSRHTGMVSTRPKVLHEVTAQTDNECVKVHHNSEANESNLKRENSKSSRSLSQKSQDLDSSDTVFKDKRSRHKGMVSTRPKLLHEVTAQTDNECVKVHHNSKANESNLKRENSDNNCPSSSKKIKCEKSSSTIQQPRTSSKKDPSVPLFDFEVTSPPKPKKTKQNFRIGDISPKNKSLSKNTSPEKPSSFIPKLLNNNKDPLSNTSSEHTEAPKDFPKIRSFRSDKNSQAKNDSKDFDKISNRKSSDSNVIAAKTSPPINQFFRVFEKFNGSSIEKNTRLITEERLTPAAYPGDKGKGSSKKETMSKWRSSSVTKALEKSMNETKENISTTKPICRSQDKHHQTRITDFCSMSNNLGSVLPQRKLSEVLRPNYN